MIDLHFHSTYSDGSLTPVQLVEAAADAGLTAVSLTDHDNTSGVDQFLDACTKHRIRGISGVEISADVKYGTLHMLGYFIHHHESDIENNLAQIRAGRDIRNRRILEKLNALGMTLTWGEVDGLAGGEVIGRPHFAMAMTARGYVGSTEEAFTKYLAKGKPAYVERFRFTAEDSIRMISKAGGLAVLAHPFTLNLNNRDLAAFVTGLRDAGLHGIEVYYSEHNPAQVEQYCDLAGNLGLIMTGGSDFHGAMNPLIKLGAGFGNLSVPDNIVDAMLERLKGATGVRH